MMQLTFKTRSITRAQWKYLWRQLRIINREAALAAENTMLFGTGFLEIGAHVPDFIRAVHPSEIVIKADGVVRVQ